MTDREALLRAVCENPDDDTPRLAFADWCDENGEDDRAEFIRLQIEAVRGADDARLRSREQELLAAHRATWSEPFRQFEIEGSFRRFVFGVHFRRGFVWAISINDEELRFVDNAAALFRLAPIERVNLFHKGQHADLARCPELLRVKELLLDRQGFETEEIEALLRSPYLQNLVRLELIADDDNGHLETGGLERLGRAKTLPALRHLDLSYNYCGWMFSDERETWVERLTKGKLIGQLETLRLRSTDVTDEGAQIIARCKRVSCLQHLDLSGNSIGEKGLQAIATSRTLPALTTLDLRGNRCETEDGTEVEGCPPATRQLLEDRFGAGLLLDGKPDPHPIDEWFKQCT
jgi:uncharacterized protein (TIGR02996 family)